VRRLKFTNTLGTPVVLQKTVSDFLRNGGYDHHLPRFGAPIIPSCTFFPRPSCATSGRHAAQPAGGRLRALGRNAARVDTLRLHREALKQHINDRARACSP